MRRSPGSRTVLAGTLVFLYAPILVLIVYSFNESRFGARWTGATLQWYERLFTSAETMGVPLGTVKTYIHRARNELKKTLEHLRPG